MYLRCFRKDSFLIRRCIGCLVRWSITSHNGVMCFTFPKLDLTTHKHNLRSDKNHAKVLNCRMNAATLYSAWTVLWTCYFMVGIHCGLMWPHLITSVPICSWSRVMRVKQTFAKARQKESRYFRHNVNTCLFVHAREMRGFWVRPTRAFQAFT